MPPKRQSTTPQELSDPEDCTVNDAAEANDGIDDVRLHEYQTTTRHDTHHHDPTALPMQEALPPQTWRQRMSVLPLEVRNLLSGGIAGMIAKSVVAPLERIKILYQVSSAKFHIWKIPTVMYNIVQNEGLQALWKGNLATMIRVFPYSGVQFMVFDRCKLFFLCEHEQGRYVSFVEDHSKWGLTPVESLIAGMVAGTVSVVVTYPLDLTRAQLAVLRRHHHDGIQTKSFVAVLTDNYRQRGLMGLFRGITPTLMGILPYSGIAFTLNEQGKKRIQNMTGRDLKTIERIQCGAISGLFAQTLTYPLEVCRRRMQTLGLLGTDTAFGNLGVQEKVDTKPPTLLGTIRNLYAEQGIRGFYKGVSMNWMKGPVAFSISFTAYDIVKGLIIKESDNPFRIPRRVSLGAQQHQREK